ncbi:hypothetical protein [Amycolatopsis jiangsuensis]|uniref:Uncharacterized protein n=1 Tax=Amycolatopsis jiangsuensis TaxID=1181879 RepID=A0A840IQH6_9PSEU|nr:hypothetical protein [Amycolatopsis jiangsuensis]MBB4684636.1 hypothetical protein [Amycolatopsis jiangsuensis]
MPSTPEGLEDYVAALFQASGNYVEKNLIQRDPSDVLELDVVATKYDSMLPESLIAEVKSGNWGYPDLFKVLGWMAYLGKPEGVLFAAKSSSKDISLVANKFAPWGLKVVCFEGAIEPLSVFSDAGLGRTPEKDSVDSWRFSYEIERKLVGTLIKAARSTDKRGPQVAVKYHRLVNGGVFFAESETHAVAALYGEFQRHPRLTLSTAHEQDGRDFDDALNGQQSALYGQALNDGEHPLLQACFYTEHMARLSILRAAVDICCRVTSELDRRPSDEDWNAVELDGLPATFCSGLRWLSRQHTFYRYALFWQNILWNWGGFVLTDQIDDEHAWMSEESGVPVDEIASAMLAFDKFFPSSSSWITDFSGSKLSVVKLVPAYFRGIGCHRRNVRYNWDNSLKSVLLSKYSKQCISKWNHSAVQFLAGI